MLPEFYQTYLRPYLSPTHLRGCQLKHQGQQKYINRLWIPRTVSRRHSNFWVGLYGQSWIINWDYCWQLVEQLMSWCPQKLPAYQRGLKAMSLIQVAPSFSV